MWFISTALDAWFWDEMKGTPDIIDSIDRLSYDHYTWILFQMLEEKTFLHGYFNTCVLELLTT